MKKRAQASDSTASSKRKRRGVRFEFEFAGEGREQAISWLVEKMKRVKPRTTAEEKESEKVEDDSEVNGRQEN